MSHSVGRVSVAVLCIINSLIAQSTPGKELSLTAGKGELLQFQGEVQRVVVSEPRIADALVVSPHEVMINAKGPGNTTVMIWEAGLAVARYDVGVVPDVRDWELFRRQLKESAGTTVEATGTGDTIVLTGSVTDTEALKRAAALASTRAKNVVNLLQAPAAIDPRQVLLQVKFASVDRAALSELGFNLFSTNPKMLGALSTQQFSSPRFTQLQLQNFRLDSTNVNFADLLNLFVFRPDLNIGATVRALAGRNLLQILAEPNLIAIEGSEASFIAGGQFPFPTIQSTTTGGAVAPVVTVQFKPFGIQLNFKPTITPSGAIHLKVRPEVSALDFSNAVTLQGFLIPAVSTRSAETEVVLRDGESFAIAGLIDNRVIEVLNRVKGLGDIPILGNLFRSRSTHKTTDELLVVITPRFVKALTPDESAKLPDTVEAFLPTVPEEKAKEKKKGKDASKASRQPEFVGPRGHQEPK